MCLGTPHVLIQRQILAIKFGIDDKLQVSCTFQDILKSEIKSKHDLFKNKKRFSVKVAHL